MARKPHPAEARALAEIARAINYAVHFRKGPNEVYRETAANIPEARAIERRMNIEHGASGRRAGVYAVTPEGASHLLPDSMQ